uniref:Ig-like domain-containing protein n=1 Tax=Sinocyclocheilus rhinocerous TaxID=307959 RepID=A0A673N0F8_9TELE
NKVTSNATEYLSAVLSFSVFIAGHALFNACPVVSVSHISALGGFPTILCSSEGFYPSALEQLWMRNGEFQNASLTHSINKTNPDGSFTLHSYLNISDCVNYSCWVNHSSLSQPTILHMSPDCYGNRGITCFYLKYIIALNTIVCLIGWFC